MLMDYGRPGYEQNVEAWRLMSRSVIPGSGAAASIAIYPSYFVFEALGVRCKRRASHSDPVKMCVRGTVKSDTSILISS